MNDPICPIADADTDVRYLAGHLSAEEAEAFEEHYFECDICWNAVQRGAEIRSALASEPAPARERGTRTLSPQQSRVRRPWMPLFAAAAVMVVVAGLWRVQRPVSEPIPIINTNAEPTRGSSTSPAISVTLTDKALAASWPRATDAQTYRVRLLADDGGLLFDTEIPDTSVVVPVSSLARPGAEGAIYWQVEALNGLRVVVSSYALKEARPGR